MAEKRGLSNVWRLAIFALVVILAGAMQLADLLRQPDTNPPFWVNAYLLMPLASLIVFPRTKTKIGLLPWIAIVFAVYLAWNVTYLVVDGLYEHLIGVNEGHPDSKSRAATQSIYLHICLFLVFLLGLQIVLTRDEDQSDGRA